ncbi:MAG: hypothetical protein ACO3EP_01560, partial [Phycisphaerales bacterium]
MRGEDRTQAQCAHVPRIEGQPQVQAARGLARVAVPGERRAQQHVPVRHCLRPLHGIQCCLRREFELRRTRRRVAWQFRQQRAGQAQAWLDRAAVRISLLSVEGCSFLAPALPHQ